MSARGIGSAGRSADSNALNLLSLPGGFPDPAYLWRSLLRAWLGADTVGRHAVATREKVVTALRERLQALGFTWLDSQLAAAETVFAGGNAPEHFFVTGAQEASRRARAAAVPLLLRC